MIIKRPISEKDWEILRRELGIHWRLRDPFLIAGFLVGKGYIATTTLLEDMLTDVEELTARLPIRRFMRGA